MEFRAPKENRAVVAWPPLADWPNAVAANRKLISTWDFDLLGIPIAGLRDLAKRDLSDRLLAFAGPSASGTSDSSLPNPHSPLIVTGHQPELIHPGVWVKSFATAGIARAAGGRGIHVVIDNDVIKSASITVPAGNPPNTYLAQIPFDAAGPQAPFEERTIVDEGVFRRFAERVQAEMASYPFTPLIADYWLYAQAPDSKSIGRRFTSARHALEVEFGCDNGEALLSSLCESASFAIFAMGVIERAHEFLDCHNTALAEYRARNRIKSRNHPVTDLVQEDDWIEMPFWMWKAADPERRRAFVRQTKAGYEIRADRESVGTIVVNGADEPDVLLHRFLAAVSPWKLRPRALMTTMYLRLCIADLFIHGIGGGKYDELTDAIIRRFLDAEPPIYAVLSATMYLPNESNAGDLSANLRAAQTRVRDLYWNPDRHLDDFLREQEPIENWIERKQELCARSAVDRTGRRERFHEFRDLNSRLRRYLGAQAVDAKEEEAKLRQAFRASEVFRYRELAFCLHPREELERLTAPLLQFDPGRIASLASSSG